jgi:hypothetical protein
VVTESHGRGWENEVWSSGKSEQENTFFRTTERKPELLEKMGLLGPSIFFIIGRKRNDNL